jgi:two-component system chemotaxis sensor kinase CheA
MNDRYGDIFREEGSEILGRLENALIELEEHPRDQEIIGKVFRDLHTIKGSGAMAGFVDVAAFAHEVESVFDLVRKNRLPASRELISLTLAARDLIKEMINGVRVDVGRREELIAALHHLSPALPEAASADRARATYRILFRPSPDIFLQGLNPLPLLRELQRLGECRVRAGGGAVPFLEEADPEFCYLHWDVMLTTDAGEDAIRDVFIFVNGDSELSIETVEDNERGDMEETGPRRDPESAEVCADVAPSIIEGRVPPADRLAEHDGGSIRVRSRKLDSLVDLIGELVTVQARLSQTAGSRNDADLSAVAEEVERLTWDLRDQVLNIRMLPIGSTFSKLNRLVRDLSAELNKEVVLETSGAATELDKTVIERLHDPLVHLIRNCIDHGIESPLVRRASGKPERGTISLSASHSGASVVLVVSDDGAGLNREALHRQAAAMGLAGGEAGAGERDLSHLIFTPGFSTASEVTAVSGRGVGMDVVKRAIDALRGSIEIHSRPGAGTSFTFRLPDPGDHRRPAGRGWEGQVRPAVVRRRGVRRTEERQPCRIRAPQPCQGERRHRPLYPPAGTFRHSRAGRRNRTGRHCRAGRTSGRFCRRSCGRGTPDRHQIAESNVS